MYSYYGLSVFPSMHKYLWWKKYLTQAQLVCCPLFASPCSSQAVKGWATGASLGGVPVSLYYSLEESDFSHYSICCVDQ